MLIFDVGMHNGDDTQYYLEKGGRVIGIEAIPDLCEKTRSRFAEQIRSGQLTILNVAVGEKNATEVSFFVNPAQPRMSSLTPSSKTEKQKITIPMRTLSGIFGEFGSPHFVKIDIENYDHIVLKELRESNALPSHLSVEANSFKVVEELIRSGYSSFRLMHGHRVPRDFRQHQIVTRDAKKAFSFRPLMSGPFGEDFSDPWTNTEIMLVNWLHRHTLQGPGYYDLHAKF
jgi:FkbM family methyltransferase